MEILDTCTPAHDMPSMGKAVEKAAAAQPRDLPPKKETCGEQPAAATFARQLVVGASHSGP
eukprot:scaffold270103_cov17-Tisochrysis_lutea.AAC.2